VPIDLLSRNSKLANFPNIHGSFSEISQSNRTISKIITLVKFIVLFPINLVKDTAYHVARPFRKDASEVSFKNRIIAALSIVKQGTKTSAEKIREFANKNKKTLVKLSTASLALGGSYAGYSYLMQLKPAPINKLIIAGGVSVSFLLACCIYKCCSSKNAKTDSVGPKKAPTRSPSSEGEKMTPIPPSEKEGAQESLPLPLPKLDENVVNSFKSQRAWAQMRRIRMGNPSFQSHSGKKDSIEKITLPGFEQQKPQLREKRIVPTNAHSRKPVLDNFSGI